MSAGPVVVGYDGSAASGRALDRAIADAKAAAQPLVIVTVEATPFDPNMPSPFIIGPPPLVSATEDKFLEPADLNALSDGAMKRATAAGVSAEVVWDMGDPMRVIVDAARDRDASEVVLGGHHFNLLQRFLGEDVPAAVKRRLDCDVVVVD
jgi:nucleotide-binding universal stress UspA family protein